MSHTPGSPSKVAEAIVSVLFGSLAETFTVAPEFPYIMVTVKDPSIFPLFRYPAECR
jgi:hypothetical protein